MLWERCGLGECRQDLGVLIKPGFPKRCSIPVLCDGTPAQGQGLCAGPGDLSVPESTLSGLASMGTVPWTLAGAWCTLCSSGLGRALPASAMGHGLGSCSPAVGWQPQQGACRL